MYRGRGATISHLVDDDSYSVASKTTIRYFLDYDTIREGSEQ